MNIDNIKTAEILISELKKVQAFLSYIRTSRFEGVDLNGFEFALEFKAIETPTVITDVYLAVIGTLEHHEQRIIKLIEEL